MRDSSAHPETAQPDGEGDRYLVRWRGKEEGPYPLATIEAKLEANQIGLLHEINCQGEWLTIREYFAQQEALIRQRLAVEEAERCKQAEQEREARAREEHQQAALSAEKARLAAKAEAESPHQSQAAPGEPLPPPRPSGSSGLRTLGVVVFGCGLVVVAYFFLSFDISVESGYGRVNNLGLMADRQDGLLVGLGLAIVGTIMLVVGVLGKK